jgi:hypothetical protein
MPKDLAEESSSEVDGSPLVYNARDYNRHHREIRAIQCFLRGAGEDPSGFEELLSEIERLVEDAARGDMMVSFSGIAPSGEVIPPPGPAPTTVTAVAAGAAATEISVATAEDFPSRGALTKMNSLAAREFCSNGIPPGEGNRCLPNRAKVLEYDFAAEGETQVTPQEFVLYDGIRRDDGFDTFLNCTRGYDGTTATAIEEGEGAVVMPGRASLLLSPNIWTKDEDVSLFQFLVSSDSDLTVACNVYERGSRQRLKPPAEIIAQVAYSWVYVGGVFIPEGMRSLACLL